MSDSINKSEKLVYYFFSSHYKKIILFIFLTLILSATYSYINYKKNLMYTSDYDVIFNSSANEGIIQNLISTKEIAYDFIFFLKKNNIKNRHEYFDARLEKIKMIRIKINHVSLNEKNIAEINKIQDLIERYKDELIDRANFKLNSINNELNTLFKIKAEVVASQKIEDTLHGKLIIDLHTNKSILLDTISFIKNDNLILHSHNDLIKKTLNIRQVFTKNLLTSLIFSLLFILFLLWIKICISEVRKN